MNRHKNEVRKNNIRIQIFKVKWARLFNGIDNRIADNLLGELRQRLARI